MVIRKLQQSEPCIFWLKTYLLKAMTTFPKRPQQTLTWISGRLKCLNHNGKRDRFILRPIGFAPWVESNFPICLAEIQWKRDEMSTREWATMITTAAIQCLQQSQLKCTDQGAKPQCKIQAILPTPPQLSPPMASNTPLHLGFWCPAPMSYPKQ